MELKNMKDLVDQQMYKDPFSRLKPSIKPIYQNKFGRKHSSLKKEDKQKRSSKGSKGKLSPR